MKSTADVNPHIQAVLHRFTGQAPEAADLQRRLDAITARIDGEWDNPALMSFGALTVEPFVDVLRIARGEMPTDVDAHRPQASDRERG
jgi:hypothetical protein